MDYARIIAAAVLGLFLVVAVSQLPEGSLGGNQVPGINLYPETFEQNVVDIDGSSTLTQGQSGSIVYSTTTAPATTTLPAARKGLTYTFVVDEAIATGNWIVASAEGDNISGTLSVNNADVDCAAEDQLNFVTDGETVGDYFTLVGNDSGWLIQGSEVAAAAKLTCTDD